MGSFASKAWNEMNEYYYKSENNLLKTNDCLESMDSSPAVRSITGFDPRSPTFQFDRTPIQLIDAKQKHAIDLEEIERMVQNVTLHNPLTDPRSPTFGIARTPIDLATNESITAKISEMHLSFDSNVSDVTNNSFDSLISDERCLSSTPLANNTKELKKTDDKSGQKVRTPLGCVQQKQTPNRNLVKQRKQLEITKRVHMNSLLKKSKSIADTASDNSLKGHHIIDDKENY